MNKQEFQQKLDEGLALIEKKEYAQAVDLFDDVMLDSLKDPRALQLIAKAYEKCRRYADAQDILAQAHKCAPRSRGPLFHLCTVSIKGGDLSAAMKYYNEFCQIAKYDNERYILQYRIAQAEGRDDDELIKILENFNDAEPDDRWMYELAKLYTSNNRIDEALEVCDQITLWFSTGKYVSLAKELKAYLTGVPLPPEEQMDYEEDAAPEENNATVQPEVIPVTSFAQEPEASKEKNAFFDEPVYEAQQPKTETYASAYAQEKTLQNDVNEEPSFAAESDFKIDFVPDTTVFSEAEETTDFRKPQGLEIREIEESRLPEGDETLAEAMEENFPKYQWEETEEKDVKVTPVSVGQFTLSAAELAQAEAIRAAQKARQEELRRAELARAEALRNAQAIRAVERKTEECASVSEEAQRREEMRLLHEAELAQQLTEKETKITFTEPEVSVVSDVKEAKGFMTIESFDKESEMKETIEEMALPEAEAVPEESASAETEAASQEESAAKNAEETSEEETVVKETEASPAGETVAAETEAVPQEEITPEMSWLEAQRAEARRLSEEIARQKEELRKLEIKKEEEAQALTGAKQEALKAEQTGALEEAKKAFEQEKEITPVAEEVKDAVSFSMIGDGLKKVEEDAIVFFDGNLFDRKEEQIDESALFVEEDDEPLVITKEKEERKPAPETKETEPAPETKETEPAPETKETEPAPEMKEAKPELETKVTEAKETEPEPEEKMEKPETSEVKPGKIFDVPEEEEIPERPSETACEPEDWEAALAERKATSEKLGHLPIETEITQKTWHFIVFGEKENETLERAQELLKEFTERVENCPKRMLKTHASRIANANIVESLDHFLGSMVIIQGAASLSDEQLQDFTKVLEKDDNSLLIVFTDTQEHFEKLFERKPALGECFTAAFEGHSLTPRELVNAAKEYLYYQQALMTEEAEGVCYEYARKLLAEKKGFYLSEIRDYAERALTAAEHTGLFGLFTGAVDKEGFIHVTDKFFKKAEERR